MPEKKHHYDLTEAIEIIERLKAERDDLKSRLAQQGADKVEVSLLGAANLGLNALHECIVPKGAEVQVSDAMRALRSAINAHTDLRVQPGSGEDAKDAARYRWLLQRVCMHQAASYGCKFEVINLPPHFGDCEPDPIPPFNAAIDAAMQQGGQS